MKQKQRLKILFLLIYLLAVAYITFISRIPSLARTVRLLPFWSFIDWSKGNWGRGSLILLNIGLFVPIGWYLYSVNGKRRWTLLICLMLTIAIEAIQFISYHGMCDIDDVISNCAGGAIGIFLHQRCRGWKWNRYIPYAMLAAGLIGCIITTTNTVIYEPQFDFNVSAVTVVGGQIELEGTCEAYYRDGLGYQLLINGSDGLNTVATVVDGKKFTGTAEKMDGELYIQFHRYQPMATSVFINSGVISYVPADTPEPEVSGTDIDFIAENGTLKVYNADYDVFVYQIENRLYWLIGKDFDASIIYHLYTTEPDKLPENRQQYGFDNRSFQIGSEKEITSLMNCGRYRVFTDIIPEEYRITAIVVGMNEGSEIKWKQYFRVNRI